MGSAASDSGSLLDQFVPNWHFREVHSRRIAAPPERIMNVALALRLRDVPISGTLLALRLAPAAFAARRWPFHLQRNWVELFVELGFVELARTEHEFVLGAVGAFWRIREELEPISDADAFARFREPGYAKAGMNLRVLGGDHATTLVTETRVWTTDDRALRSFRPYWIPVRAMGGLMRRELLAATARRSGVPS